MAILGFAMAALVGLSLGVLGGGGSILTVPIFVYVLGYAAKDAIAMSLIVVGATSLVGAFRHWQAGNVDLRVALAFGSVAMAGAFVGARLARLVSGPTQLAIFAVVMLAAAFFMYRDRRADAGVPKLTPTSLRGYALLLLPGVAVGMLTGLVGVGGGFLIVPTLVLLARLPIKQAVGTSLLVIAMNASSGFAGYIGQVQVQWSTLLGFTVVAIVGILLGSSLVPYVSARTLRRWFATFLVVMGLLVLFQNRAVLQRQVSQALSAKVAASIAVGGGVA